MTLNLTELRDQWLCEYEDVTRKNYTYELNLFSKFVAGKMKKGTSSDEALQSLMQAGKQPMAKEIEAWRRSQQKAGISASSIIKRVAIVSGFLKHAFSVGAIDFVYQKKTQLRRLKPSLQGPRPDEISKLQAHLLSHENEYFAARDCAILRLNYDLSLRSNEIFQLNMSDLFFEDLNSRFIMAKLKRHDEKIRRDIPPTSYDALVKWISAREKWIKRYASDKTGLKTGPVFISLGQRHFVKRLDKHSWTSRLKKLAKDVGISRVNTQLIRHTSITVALEKVQRRGMPIETVLAFTGHSDLQTLLSYRDGLQKYQPHIAWLVSEEVTTHHNLKPKE